MAEADVYPYIPNSVPEVRAEMLGAIGISSVEEIFAEIPDHLRFKGELDVPGPISSEYALRRHVEEILAKNKDCKEYIGFLGGGVYNHFVPSVVTTIMERDEFLTSYVGEAYADHGKWQAQFEYASCLAELLEMDAVNTPTYDWGMGAATAIRMAARITGRSTALVAASISPDRLSCMKNYGFSALPTFGTIKMDPETGLVDLEDLKAKMTDEVAVFYYENPSFLGAIEHQGSQIADIVHGRGGVVAAGVDPISLGVLEAPARYGVDIACGDIQGLGIPMSAGGGQGGFVATQDEPKFFHEFPALMFGVTPTIVEGEYGFGEVFFERTSVRFPRAGEGLPRHDGPAARHRRRRVSLADGSAGHARDRRGDHAAFRLPRRPARRPRRRQRARALGALLQGVRGQLRRDGQERGRRQQGLARAQDLRRQGSLDVVPEPGSERALLRHRGAHQG